MHAACAMVYARGATILLRQLSDDLYFTLYLE